MSSSSSEDDLIHRVVEVTGANLDEARHLLSACANNVDAAVSLYFEQGLEAPPLPAQLPAVEVLEDSLDADGVRAPIAPVREQLVRPEDDNFYGPASSNGRIVRVTQRVKVCPLRDFAREGAILEAQLEAAADGETSSAFTPYENSDSNASSSNSLRFIRREMRVELPAAAARSLAHSSSRLGDLFRPPTDIAFFGSLQTARNRAQALAHWLLVNVQSDNFNSQVLNRDVWSNKDMRALIKRQFLLWQIDADTSEGRRFVTFYHCGQLPYVCIIDPRTGEEMWKSTDPKEANLMPDLQDFLLQHKDFSKTLDDDTPSTSKRATDVIKIDDDEEQGNEKKRTKLLVELSEEEQMALAIRNSMRENGVKSKATPATTEDDSDASDSESVDELNDDVEAESTDYAQLLGEAKELTMIKLRLLNTCGTDEIIQLRWPSDTKVKVLHSYIAQCHPHVPEHGYKLICAFPRKTLESSETSTLKQLGLHPSANLHLTLDD